MKNIVIVASVNVKEAFKDEVYKELLQLHEATHKLDEGCIQYDLHKDLKDENKFTFVETWENEELLEAHKQKEHFKTFVSNTQNKLESMNVLILEKLNI